MSASAALRRTQAPRGLVARAGSRARVWGRAALLSVLLAPLPACQTAKAVYEVIEEAAVPAIVGGVMVATGAGPVAVGLAVLTADLTTQAVEGEKLQNKFEERMIEAVEKDAKEVLVDMTRRSALLRWWKEALLAILIAWALKSPSRIAVHFREWLARIRAPPPADDP